MEKVINCILIDDDSEDHEFFEIAIMQTQLQIHCTYFKCGIEAADHLKIVTHYHPDFLFLDWNMPKLNNYDYLFSLKQIPILKNTQFIIYSDYVSPDEIRDLQYTYNCRFLKKASSIQNLTTNLHSIFAWTNQ